MQSRIGRVSAITAPLVALTLATTLFGCGPGGFDTTGFAGASSMRVDVFVYKGHLSKEPEVQQAELKSAVSNAIESMEVLKSDALDSMCVVGCFAEEGKKDEPGPYTAKAELCGEPDFIAKLLPRRSTDKPKNCPILRGIHNDAQSFRTELAALAGQDWTKPTADRGDQSIITPRVSSDVRHVGIIDADLDRTFYAKTAQIGSRMSQRAEFWATRDIAIFPGDSRVRVSLSTFAETTARYGRQLVSRADALMKQTPLGGKDGVRKELAPTSVYLRDSATTYYLDAFAANQGAVTRSIPIDDRIRLIESLVDDAHWSKVNTVFAAGQGEVGMAFIRDEIGNWNLKNFSNDPEDLLDAYKNAGLAVLDTAVSSVGGGGANALLDVADRLTLGVAKPQATEASVSTMHDDIVAHIRAISQGQEKRRKELLEKKAKGESDLTLARQNLTTADANVASAETELNKQGPRPDGDGDTAKQWDAERRQLLGNYTTAITTQAAARTTAAEKDSELNAVNRDLERLRDDTERLIVNSLLLYQTSLQNVEPAPAPASTPATALTQ